MKKTNELLYLKEHLGCEHYIHEHNVGFSIQKFNKLDVVYTMELKEKFALLFVMSGSVAINSSNGEDMKVVENEMCLLSNFLHYDLTVITDAEVTIMHFDRFNSRCDKLTFEKMSKKLNRKDLRSIRKLEMHKPIVEFVENMRFYLDKGMYCRHLHDMKETELLFLMRGFYVKEDVACFFTPVIRALNDFTNMVREHYMNVNTVEELAEKCNMTAKTFTRMFKVVFDDTPKQWMIREKMKYVKVSNLAISREKRKV